MDKAYLLTAGEYEEYHVLGVFDSLEKAKKAKRMVERYHEQYDCDIEEIPFNAPAFFSKDPVFIVRVKPDKEVWNPPEKYPNFIDNVGKVEFYEFSGLVSIIVQAPNKSVAKQTAMKMYNEWKAKNKRHIYPI